MLSSVGPPNKKEFKKSVHGTSNILAEICRLDGTTVYKLEILAQISLYTNAWRSISDDSSRKGSCPRKSKSLWSKAFVKYKQLPPNRRFSDPLNHVHTQTPASHLTWLKKSILYNFIMFRYVRTYLLFCHFRNTEIEEKKHTQNVIENQEWEKKENLPVMKLDLVKSFRSQYVWVNYLNAPSALLKDDIKYDIILTHWRHQLSFNSQLLVKLLLSDCLIY